MKWPQSSYYLTACHVKILAWNEEFTHFSATEQCSEVLRYSRLLLCHMKPNVDVIKQCKHLKSMQLEFVTVDKRIQCLTSEFIDGNHHPQSFKQFVGVLNTAWITWPGRRTKWCRLASTVFMADRSYLIDFNFADKEATSYPSVYGKLLGKLDERHPQAVKFNARKKWHGCYSLKYIINTCEHHWHLHFVDKLVNMSTRLTKILINLSIHQ